MRYLCLAYGDEAKMEALSPDELAEVGRQCDAFDEQMRRSGHLIQMEGLHASSMTTGLRSLRGRLAVTDGPFTETKEQLGGYYLIEARDLNEAIQVLTRHAAALQPFGERLGWSVEVRPIQHTILP